MAGKRHEKRFIIEVKLEGDNKFFRSVNIGITQAFPTREAAQTALEAYGSKDMEYRVRMK